MLLELVVKIVGGARHDLVADQIKRRALETKLLGHVIAMKSTKDGGDDLMLPVR